MNLKNTRIISVIGIFILCFISHFVYNILPCSLTAIFFPVNESIWEHMKMIFTSIILYGIIDYIVLNKFKIKYNNFFLSLFITSIISIPIYLLIYLPIFYKIGENMFINISLMLLVIIITQIISYFILKANNYKIFNYISIILIIVCYIIFGYLTYHPIKAELFFDTKDEKYGINNYNV